MQITAPTPIYYLPENLWSLFTRPGRELVVRVLQIEGKFLYLELGGQKFQARIAGTLNPEDFRIGEEIRVRVVRTENPLTLEIIGSEKEEKRDLALLYLMVRPKEPSEMSKISLNKEISLLYELFREVFRKSEKKEGDVLEDLKDLLSKNLRTTQLHLEEDRLFIPFYWHEEKSWGYFEIFTPEERAERVKIFGLKVFFTYLGLVEAIFYYTNKTIEVELYFAEKGAKEEAKRFLGDLKKSLHFPERLVKINLMQREVEPGYFIERVG